MTPAFKITGSDGDLTDNFAQRLISLNLTDTSAEMSDGLDIELSNVDGKLIVPEQGYILTVSLGYLGQLRSMGSYMVDSIVCKGFPDTVQIQGKATPFTGAQGQQPIQSRKTRSWDVTSLSDIIQKIASENGLQAAIDSQLASTPIGHFDQICESDLNFLTRLSRDFGAVFKPAMGHLVFARRGTSQSVSGQALPTIVLDRSDVSSYRVIIGRRVRIGAVTTKYHDPKLGKVVNVTTTAGVDALFPGISSGASASSSATLSTSSSGDAIGQVVKETPDDLGYSVDTQDTPATYQHPYIYPDQTTATAGAASILDQSERGEHNIEVAIAGRPDVLAEGTLSLTGFNSVVDKDWIITSVVHSLDKTGYRTRIVSEKKRVKASVSTLPSGAITIDQSSNIERVVSGGG